MKCPYCNNKMDEGTIDVYDTLCWTPKGEKRTGLTKWSTAQGGITLAKYGLISSASKEAFYCKDCKKIVMDVD